MRTENTIRNILKKIIAVMIMFSIIFTSLQIKSNNIVFATEVEAENNGTEAVEQEQNEEQETKAQVTVPSDEEIFATMKKDINNWLNPPKDDEKHSKVHDNKIYKYEYKEEAETKVTYAVKMPKPSYVVNGKQKITFNGNSGMYMYNVYDSEGNIVKQVQFDVKVLLGTDTVLPENINSSNYSNYTGLSGNVTLETTKGELLKVVDIEKEDEKYQLSFAIVFNDGTIVKTPNAEVEGYENGESWGKQFGDMISNAGAFLLDLIGRPVIEILNSILINIADGIKFLINGIFGQEVSIYEIIFGKVDKLSINYWETSNQTESSKESETENPSGIVDNSPSATLKGIVSHWYGVFRGIVIAVYIVMLLYIGIRILLSSTGKSGQKYKEMLTSWLVGIVILTFYPYVMRYTVIINDLLIGMMDPHAVQQEEQKEEESEEAAEETPSLSDKTNTDDNVLDTMEVIRIEAEETNNMALTVIYIVMLGQLIVLIGVYYKRVFMMAFLITIFPIVAGIYVWEKTKGGGKALTTWTKEYVILVLTQTFHAVVYVVLIDGAYLAFQQSNNWVIFLISVMFLFEAEKIIRTIFGMRSSANTIGDLATAGAAALAASKKVKDVVKGEKKSTTEDDTNEKEATQTANEAKKNVAVQNALASTNSSIAASHGGLSGGSSSSGSGSSGSGSSGGGSSGGGSSGGGGHGGGSSHGYISDENQMDNLHAAQAVVTADAYKGRNKRGIIAKAINVTGRAAGITLGATSGLAQGSMKDAFANAAIGNEIGGIAAKLPMAITGWAGGAYAGKIMKRKIERGDMDEELHRAGYDLSRRFDTDDAVSQAKANLYRKALAVQAEVTRRSGKAAGEQAFIDIVEKERKKNGF